MAQTETAIFAGGCFWCMVQPFDTQPGIQCRLRLPAAIP